MPFGVRSAACNAHAYTRTPTRPPTHTALANTHSTHATIAQGFEPRQRFRIYASLAARGKVLPDAPAYVDVHAYSIPHAPSHTPVPAAAGYGGITRANVSAEMSGSPRAEPLAPGCTGGGAEGGAGGEGVGRRRVRSSAAVRARQWLREWNLEIRMLLIEVGGWVSRGGTGGSRGGANVALRV